MSLFTPGHFRPEGRERTAFEKGHTTKIFCWSESLALTERGFSETRWKHLNVIPHFTLFLWLEIQFSVDPSATVFHVPKFVFASNTKLATETACFCRQPPLWYHMNAGGWVMSWNWHPSDTQVSQWETLCCNWKHTCLGEIVILIKWGFFCALFFLVLVVDLLKPYIFSESCSRRFISILLQLT